MPTNLRWAGEAVGEASKKTLGGRNEIGPRWIRQAMWKSQLDKTVCGSRVFWTLRMKHSDSLWLLEQEQRI